jgi:hypothetical protein
MRLNVAIRRTCAVCFAVTLLAGCAFEDQGSSSDVKGQAPLVRPDSPPDHDARGRITHNSRNRGTRLKLDAHLLDPGLGVETYLEDLDGLWIPLGSGVTGANGNFSLRVDSNDLGVVFYEGFSVAIANASTDEILLVGKIPTLFHGGYSFSRTDDLDNRDRAFAPAGSGDVLVKYAEASGWGQLRIRVSAVPAASALDVFLENPESAILEKIATLLTDADGSASLDIETKTGRALPFGVTDSSDLFGLAVELRTLDATLRFSGFVPGPD